MKKILIFPLIFLILSITTSCKEEDTPEPVSETSIVVEVKKEVKSTSGQVTRDKVSAIVHVWSAENEDFDIEASGSDINLGYAYDKKSGEYKTAEYGSVGWRMNESIEPGKYFIYIVLKKSTEAGSLAYTYRYFEVKEGEKVTLKKTFSLNVPSGTFEAWDKNS